MKIRPYAQSSEIPKRPIQGYHSLHKWIQKHFGTPKICECCKTKKAKKYEWANKNGEYTRDRKNWFRLCVSCHRTFDSDKESKKKTRLIQKMRLLNLI